jgi:uncharacterized protein YdiU (UPF0061 family)|tara:strand:+ start:1690 stop:3276 length:1587 start_codon:yes stop_codon:yes gene_type:complete
MMQSGEHKLFELSYGFIGPNYFVIMNTNTDTSDDNPIRYQHYRDLPAEMFAESMPSQTASPTLIELNENLLEQLGIESSWFVSQQALSLLSGNSINEDNRPIALAYSGHQFGNWSALLGDGRAHMLGQLKTAEGEYFDVQLKGSGRTQFSRGGDGRATLGSVIREYLLSEAMMGLGIPTTRSIALLTTGDTVAREKLNPGAILVRSAQSHLRVGSFQFAHAKTAHLKSSQSQPSISGVKALADFTIAQHFPELEQSTSKYLDLLSVVGTRQATLIAKWMLVGFIHGVMNTDNVSIVGETIDFGPCAFMDEYNPQKVFSSIDTQGRYAWDQQPMIAQWNLTRLAETLLPLFDDNEEKSIEMAQHRLSEFMPQFQKSFQTGLMLKLGFSESNDQTQQLTSELLSAMQTDGVDFTVFFNNLTGVAQGESKQVLINLFNDLDGVSKLVDQWQELRAKDSDSLLAMRQANPVVIARNHQVQFAIDAAVEKNDFLPFRRLCRVLANPYLMDSADDELMKPPKSEERVTQTFCGT